MDEDSVGFREIENAMHEVTLIIEKRMFNCDPMHAETDCLAIILIYCISMDSINQAKWHLQPQTNFFT